MKQKVKINESLANQIDGLTSGWTYDVLEDSGEHVKIQTNNGTVVTVSKNQLSEQVQSRKVISG